MSHDKQAWKRAFLRTMTEDENVRCHSKQSNCIGRNWELIYAFAHQMKQYKEIAQKYDLSRDRIGQIIDRAIDRLDILREKERLESV